jgi:two-component system, NarL family, nitrate/nitrite response regulator NarL
MKHQPEPIRIFIVCNLRVSREALVQVLSGYATVAVAGSRPNDEGALEEIACSRPDAVLVDWSAVSDNGTVRRLGSASPGVKVIAFGVAENEGEVLACAAAGVSGYIPQDAPLDALVRRIGAVVRGELLCSPRMAAIMFRHVGSMQTSPATPSDSAGPGSALTPREAEIANLLELGLSNKEIARALGIRVATVKNHVHHVLRRLQIRRRTEAGVANRQRNHITPQ